MSPRDQRQARVTEAVINRLRVQLRAIFGRRRRPNIPPRFPKTVSHYELLKAIGAGARGNVYLARDRRSDRLAALKMLRNSTDRESRQRFFREAGCASAIAHPNVVRFYEIVQDVQDPDIAAIAMEYIPGQTLHGLIPKRGLPLKTWLDYALQIAEAVAAIHSARMVHRDLKPANFIVTKAGTVKLLDFGLAKIIVGRRRRPSRTQWPKVPETREGTILGTPAYMSPEQARGLPADQRSDVFSLGLLFYEMLTGRPAFHEISEVETMSAIVREAAPDLPARIPTTIARLVRRCLAKEPGRRYQGAEEVLEALARAAQNLYRRRRPVT